MAYTGIDKSTDYFNTKLYTGNGSTNAITGVGFATDMTWMKSTTNNTDHAMFDSVRGVTKEIRPNKTDYEDTAANGLTAFDSDGFTLGDWTVVNLNAESYASWNWKLGTTSGITTNGSTTITPTAYSFNATTGMSAIKCAGTGAAGLFPHGLGVAPRIVITKDLTSANLWAVQTDLITSWTSSNYLKLNDTTAVGNSTDIVNATDATNVSLAGSDDWVNAAGRNYIHYCFTEKTGFSKLGTYTGNGNADGSFIYCGFKPAWVMQKRTDSANNWNIYDVKRNTFNIVDKYLYADDNSTQITSDAIDITSNGFKCRSSSTFLNTSGGTYIYMAFAEAPLVGSNNIAATAR